MLVYLLDMISFKSQFSLTPVEENIKYRKSFCLEFADRENQIFF
jgi:hypothetical protein